MVTTFIFWMFSVPLVIDAKSGEIADRIVAVVNDDVITLFELNSMVGPYAEKVRSLGYPLEKEKKMLYKVREDMLNRLIDEKIGDQEIKRSKIKISGKEIDQTIERIKETNYITDEDLRAKLAQEGLTMEEYRNQIEKQILRTRLVNIEVKSKIVITTEDIASYYESHRSQYGGKKKYHLRSIIMKISPLDDKTKKLEVKDRMDAVLEELKAGQPFEAMAKSYSESLTAADGGELGVFELDTLSPQLQAVVKQMKAGEFTPVLDTDQGYQIFWVQEIFVTKEKSLEEVSPEIEKKLYDEIAQKRYQSWISDLRKQSVIKIIQ
jgi:peptidyl-prolyl cis-trans isomerase SurA